MVSENSLVTLPRGGPGRFWRGDERLWRAFWLFWFAGGWAVSVVVSLLVQSVGLPPLAAIALLMLYTVWAGVAVWRCAFNVKTRFWGYLARGIILVFVALLIVRSFEGWLGGGAGT